MAINKSRLGNNVFLRIGIICMLINTCISTLAANLMSNEPFIFVRHGSTDWSTENIPQGVQNLHLNEQGKAEAALAAEILMSFINTDNSCYIIIASTLHRAAETAATISNKTHIPIFYEDGLQEHYYGDFTQGTKIDLCGYHVPLDAESEQVFQTRVFTTFDKIFKSNKYQEKSKKILVSHGGVFKYLSKLLTEKEETIPRGGIAIFIPSNKKNDQRWSIHYLTKEFSLHHKQYFLHYEKARDTP